MQRVHRHAGTPIACAQKLDVSCDNSKAQRLYERMGFSVVEERWHSGGRGFGGSRRMRRPITGDPR
jgi:ribosomal protein S18 acetylase RimI-like enzyme